MPPRTTRPPAPARLRTRSRHALLALSLILPGACRDGTGPARRSDRIVFQSYRDGAHHIYSMKSDGSDVTQLTTAGDLNIHPARSPDGSRIAYISSRAPAGLRVMNADGSGDRALNVKGENDEYPAWSPDGKQIVVQSRRDLISYRLYVVNADGSGVRKLNTQCAFEAAPSWSPDGSRIAFRCGFGIATVRADGSGDLRILASSDLNNGIANDMPAWSPDGRTIAFVRNPDPDPALGYVIPYQVYLVDANGGNRRRITSLTAGAALTPAWSPDGRWIVFSRDLSSEFDLFVMRADGSESRPLTGGSGGDYRPSW